MGQIKIFLQGIKKYKLLKEIFDKCILLKLKFLFFEVLLRKRKVSYRMEGDLQYCYLRKGLY